MSFLFCVKITNNFIAIVGISELLYDDILHGGTYGHGLKAGAISCKDGYGYLSLFHRCQPENSRSARNRKQNRTTPTKTGTPSDFGYTVFNNMLGNNHSLIVPVNGIFMMERFLYVTYLFEYPTFGQFGHWNFTKDLF